MKRLVALAITLEITLKIVGGLIVGAGLLLNVNPTEAEYRYTDDKGKSRTVTLKMDVPAQYRATAVWVDPGSNIAPRQDKPRRPTETQAAMPQAEQKATGPVMWWTLPVDSPERAAAKQEAEQQAALLRQRATSAGVRDPSTTGPTGDPFTATANTCRALVNDTGSRGLDVEGADEFKASVGGGTIHMIGTPEAKFAYAKCMADRGQPIKFK